jgi:tRNA dimethylallyltransferase
MNIGTGKDLPVKSKLKIQNSKLPGFYEVNGVRIWGYDLADPKRKFSVAHYIKIAERIINDIWRRNKLPILVGGTGLYIKGIVDGIPTAQVPRNEILRKSLEKKSREELFEILKYYDSDKAKSLNSSDRKNPRRLVRAIEIARQKSDFRYQMSDVSQNSKDVLFIGLTMPREDLYGRIGERVDMRLKQGFENEVNRLITSGVSWKDQSLQTLGYKQWREYIVGRITREEAMNFWKQEEKKYAKRQITWFKKERRINWFDVLEVNWRKNVEKLIRGWYSNE